MTDNHRPISPADLVKVGEALFGEHWVTPLARELGVNVRTLQRVKRAALEGVLYRLGPGWPSALARALRAHAVKLEALAAALD